AGIEAGSGEAADPRRPTCDLPGCARWRGTLLGTGPVAVGPELAVAARQGGLVAVDVASGQPRWRASLSAPDDPIQALHVDERVVALADGRTVTTLDPRSGAVRGSSRLAVDVRSFRRADGQLIAAGRDRSGEVVVGLDDRGGVRFVRAGTLADHARAATAPLLVTVEGTFQRLDATTGRVRWSVPLGGRVRDGLTLLDRADGRIEVLDPLSGEVLLSRSVPGAVAAGVRSGVLAVVTPDRVVLLGRDGALLGDLAGLEATATVLTAVASRVTVVEVRSATAPPRVLRRQATGGASGLPGPSHAFDLPGTDVLGDELGQPVREVGATRRSDGLLVATDRRAWVVPPGGEQPLAVEVPVGRSVQHVDGLAIRRTAEGLDLGGAGGQVAVRGASEVLSLDPLLVRGPGGTLRLDRTLLDG
ncbi:MAG: PQQ-binding-like beta-propeller repeat protein, partial [Nitriliruptoraceae bacterium]